MEHILEKARELGRLIAESEEYRALNAMDEKVSRNAEVSDLYAQYADVRDQIAALELDDQADHEAIDALEDRADELQERLSRHEGMLEVNMARLTFNRMMDRINRALQAQLTGEDEFAEEAGCGGGGCAGCSGCGPER